MKILLIGKNGQLGRACHDVLKPDYEVIAISRDDIDLSQTDNILSFIFDIMPDIVINCSAFTDVYACENVGKLSNIALNFSAPTCISDVCELIGAKFIHFSTDYVFDGTKILYDSYCESDYCSPLNAYGRVKCLSERYISKYNSKYLIIRTSWLYGHPGVNFITQLLKKYKDGKTEFEIVDDQYGTPTSTFALAIQVKKIIDSKLDYNGIIHASCEGHCNWYEFADEVFEYLGIKQYVNLLKINSDQYSSSVVRPKNSILDNGVLKTLNINIMPHWKESLFEFIAMYDSILLK